MKEHHSDNQVTTQSNKDAPSERRESLRLEKAVQNLYPFYLEQHIYFVASMNEWTIPKAIEWTKDSKLGRTNIYPDGLDKPPIESYFKTQEELEDGFQQLDKKYRRFDQEKDHQAFNLGPDKHSSLMVSVDGGVAVGCKKNEKGELSVNVYTSRSFENEILEAAIKYINSQLSISKQSSMELRRKLNELKSSQKALKSK